MFRIDAHHHLWRYDAQEYAWIDDGMQALRRDFLLPDLERVLAGSDVRGTVIVQARQTLDETRWLLDLAANSALLLGVVGWLPLVSERLEEDLQLFAENGKLKGVRHVVQAEPDGFLEQPAFHRGMRTITRTGLVYDLLLYPRQLAEAIRFVDAHPHQSFVLDHLAKPDLRSGDTTDIARWATELRELAKRPHVSCKISGLVTEADPHHWTADQLSPCFRTALDAFGPDRLLAATDWPVLTLGCSYAEWWALLERWTADLSHTEQAAILGGNAARIYKLFPEPVE